MRTLRSPLLAIVLAALLPILSGVLSAQAVGHASEHSQHHSSTSHATTLCSWYCAAGQVHGAELVVFVAPVLSFLGVENAEPTIVMALFTIPSPSRAPPSV